MLLDRSRNTYIPSLNVKWMSGEAAKSTKTKLKQLEFESLLHPWKNVTVSH
jgi:hypothetical protein